MISELLPMDLMVSAQKDRCSGPVGNQQTWHTLRPERSGVRWRSCKLPECSVVLSSPFDCL